ncbi:MAG: hypothetical protein M1830_004428 [Pleopsidium flavum]|nr:MAG: hypothetical protein M1830_004428 [Pleopsidium flavum]
MFLPNLSFPPRFQLSLGTCLLVILPLCLGPIIALVLFDFSTRRAEHLEPKGCRKLGLRVKSNLADEFNKKYAEGIDQSKDGTGHGRWRVKSLWIFPVKGCRGIELNWGNVISTGMEYDRQFCFAQLKSPFPMSVDTSKSEKAAHKWEFITQRTFPLLARVETSVWIPDPSSTTYSPDHPEVRSGGVLVMTYPYQEDGWRGTLASFGAALSGRVPRKSFEVPLRPSPEQIEKHRYTTEEMVIWKDSPLALNMGVHVPPELKYSLHVRNPLTLFRVHDRNEREVFRCAPRKEQLGYQPITGFADAYPLHILNLASVQDVARRLPKDAPKLSALRFRPNIIITGPRAYAEDYWKKIKIGNYSEHYVSCRTARCRVPNTDQLSGQKHPAEPDKTLKSFRRIDQGAAMHACLGMQMVPALKESKIRVGDSIEVLESGDHYYIMQ